LGVDPSPISSGDCYNSVRLCEAPAAVVIGIQFFM